ncbi:hypothetical protein [Candidatus Accumulibacter necessarius]|uniref:hypothetical protein n=1 Tax=Candidatus Accumulibacter necessarius TaxID=2954386 RepID=UPI003DA88895
MHPTLGDFISRQFYESEGLGRLALRTTCAGFRSHDSLATKANVLLGWMFLCRTGKKNPKTRL